jgi:hypothetical protein
VTKGNANWNHQVTLDGKLCFTEVSNFVYWFRLYLQQVYNLTLEDFSNWKLTEEQKEQKLWKWSKDAMREVFKNRCQMAGYPKGKLKSNTRYLFLIYILKACLVFTL